MTKRNVPLVVCALALAACDLAPKDGGDVVDTDTAGATDGAEGQINPEDDGEEMTTGAGSDGAVDGADGASASDTGGTDGSPATQCTDACAWLLGCEPGLSMPECMADCSESLSRFDGDAVCDGAAHAMVACLGELTSCDEGDLDQACGEAAATIQSCTGSECGLGGGEGGDETGGLSCMAEEVCEDSTRAVRCENGQCECFVDGEVSGECEDPSNCDDLFGDDEQIAAFALSCCGFEDFGS